MVVNGKNAVKLCMPPIDAFAFSNLAWQPVLKDHGVHIGGIVLIESVSLTLCIYLLGILFI